jgi:hypothetical protein
MNYGYAPTKKDAELAEALSPLVSEMCVRLAKRDPKQRKRPYIERDGLYHGVRIRAITFLTDEECEELIERADAIHEEVVG